VRDEDGFTIVEVMAAMVVLLVGLAGMLQLVLAAEARTTTTKVREAGVNLQREVLEASRSVPYTALSPATVTARLQAIPGLEDASSAQAGWSVRRRTASYSIAVGACTVDDPRDGLGSHSAGTFCATGAGAATPVECETALGKSGDIAGMAGVSGTVVGDCGLDLDRDGTVDNLTEAQVAGCANGACSSASSTVVDPVPEDAKRVVTLVRWDQGDGARYALQSTTVPSPGQASGPGITTLSPVTVERQGVDSTPLTFIATTDVAPATVTWSVNGTQRGTATGSGTTWTASWAVGDATVTPDGAYVVALRGIDRYGVSGPEKAATVTLNRAVPAAPRQVRAGRNAAGVDVEWSANPEGDIVEYQVFRAGQSTPLCTTKDVACRLAGAGDGDYAVVALDRDSAGQRRLGTVTPIVVLGAATPPDPPAQLLGWTAQGASRLSWTASPSADVVGYRIYRDGTSYPAERYRSLGADAVSFTDTSGGAEQHRYWISAVDDQLGESAIVGPVTVGGVSP
jgi:prepilin-type N-terminal cleavage/methylation domain-containing protein